MYSPKWGQPTFAFTRNYIKQPLKLATSLSVHQKKLKFFNYLSFKPFSFFIDERYLLLRNVMSELILKPRADPVKERDSKIMIANVSCIESECTILITHFGRLLRYFTVFNNLIKLIFKATTQSLTNLVLSVQQTNHAHLLVRRRLVDHLQGNVTWPSHDATVGEGHLYATIGIFLRAISHENRVGHLD